MSGGERSKLLTWGSELARAPIPAAIPAMSDAPKVHPYQRATYTGSTDASEVRPYMYPKIIYM